MKLTGIPLTTAAVRKRGLLCWVFPYQCRGLRFPSGAPRRRIRRLSLPMPAEKLEHVSGQLPAFCPAPGHLAAAGIQQRRDETPPWLFTLFWRWHAEKGSRTNVPGCLFRGLGADGQLLAPLCHPRCSRTQVHGGQNGQKEPAFCSRGMPAADGFQRPGGSFMVCSGTQGSQARGVDCMMARNCSCADAWWHRRLKTAYPSWHGLASWYIFRRGLPVQRVLCRRFCGVEQRRAHPSTQCSGPCMWQKGQFITAAMAMGLVRLASLNRLAARRYGSSPWCAVAET